jgi:hypothetical protein
VRGRLSSAILCLAGAAFFVDLFFRWAPRTLHAEGSSFGRVTGWDVGLTYLAAEAVVALLLVELAGFGGVWRSRTPRLLGFFLGAAAGIFAVSALVRMHGTSGLQGFRLAQYNYPAWIGLGLAVLLLVGAALRLDEVRRGGPASGSTASPPG